MNNRNTKDYLEEELKKISLFEVTKPWKFIKKNSNGAGAQATFRYMNEYFTILNESEHSRPFKFIMIHQRNLSERFDRS